MDIHLLLMAVGLVGGFLAGWVGLGGGIILAPLLLYLPPLFGFIPLEIKEVARLTIIQSLCASAAAGAAHWRARRLVFPLVVWMGSFIAIASLGGAIVSEFQVVPSTFLLAMLATMALVAAVLMFRLPPEMPDNNDESLHRTIRFNRWHAAASAVGVGFLGGMVGQSGAFLTIPLLIHVLRVPTRLAIGSSLGITFFAALAGSAGKLAGGGTVSWQLVAALVAGSIVGSQAGSAFSHRVGTVTLRNVLGLLIAISAARMWVQVLF